MELHHQDIAVALAAVVEADTAVAEEDIAVDTVVDEEDTAVDIVVVWI